MSKKIDEQMLLCVEPILAKTKTLQDITNIKIQIKLLDKDKNTLTKNPFSDIIPKAEKTATISAILKKYNATKYTAENIIKYETSAKEIAEKLNIKETDEKYKKVSFLSFKIDANGNHDITDETEWYDVEIESEDCKNRFHKISKIILRHEGGYVNDEDDPGGETNMGITIKTWKAYAKSDLGIESTSKNLKNLTIQQAETIYYNHYWKARKFCGINDIKVALMIYDWTITSGGAIKQIQKLLNNSTYNSKISVDGGMGNQTIKAINAVSNQEQLLNNIAKTRKQYYYDLAHDNKGNRTKLYKFLKGWNNRVNDCIGVKI